jgi:hypothetical protein
VATFITQETVPVKDVLGTVSKKNTKSSFHGVATTNKYCVKPIIDWYGLSNTKYGILVE